MCSNTSIVYAFLLHSVLLLSNRSSRLFFFPCCTRIYLRTFVQGGWTTMIPHSVPLGQATKVAFSCCVLLQLLCYVCLCDVIWLLRLALSPPVLIENEFERQWRKLGMDNSGDKFFFLQKRGVTGTAASQLLWVSGKERHLGTPCPPWDRRYLSCVRLSCCTHTAAGSALRTWSSARLSFGTPLASGKVLFYL